MNEVELWKGKVEMIINVLWMAIIVLSLVYLYLFIATMQVIINCKIE